MFTVTNGLAIGKNKIIPTKLIAEIREHSNITNVNSIR